MTIDQSVLEDFLAGAAKAESVRVRRFEPLSGGAIQENFLLDAEFTGGTFAGRQELVLRADAPTGVPVSHDRGCEFALLQAAHAAGVTVPEPLWLSDGERGRNFFVMRRVGGTAAGHKLVRDEAIDGAGLTRRLGRELAKIHAMDFVPLDFLAPPEPSPALYWIGRYRHFLDILATPQPVMEWGLRWLQRNAPEKGELVLCHHDFRTGNFMVDGSGLTAVLDWEFAGIGEPLEDIGWFCARCWRFGAVGRQAGGLGGRDEFYLAYERQSGRAIDRGGVFYWEVMAHVRWAVIAAQQADRHLTGGEESLELALTGHLVPALELEIMKMTEREL